MPANTRPATMLIRRLSQRPHLRIPITERSEAGAARSSTAVILDPQALLRLHDLDPTGASKLMERVVVAFAASVARLLPLLQSAQAAGDAAGIRLVAHTLNSSSSSVGAVRLSQLCAEMEATAKQGRTAELPEAIAALSTEVTAVLDALKHVHPSSP
jgi:HPt (histidine-containing phosphotransfer) domain-containing protein